MQTYSVNIGTDTEAISYNLSDDNQFNEILNNLSDDIRPIDIRNSVLSLWSNSAFKETTNGSEYYIGIDTGNPSDKDLKYQFLIGKRMISNDNVFNSDMYSSDTDIYFYDTKDDSSTNGKSKISILSGTDINLFENSPYLSSEYNNLNSLTFNLVNDNGNIYISSNNNDVVINDIVFPKLSDNLNSDNLENKVLKWESGKLVWGQMIFEVGATFGSITEELNINGDLFVNDYNLELIDDRMIPININNINQGEKLNSSITETLKRIIYDYEKPTGHLEILEPYNNGYIEVGTTPTVIIKYTINKKTLSTLTTALQNLTVNTYPPINSEYYETITGTSSAIISPSPSILGTQSFTIITRDSLESSSNSVHLVSVYPFYYGMGLNNSLNYSINFLEKLIESKSNKRLLYLGTGKVYFLYPFEYGTLSEIIDDNDVDVLSDFNFIDINFNSPDGNFLSKKYYLYESISSYNYTTPFWYTFNF